MCFIFRIPYKYHAGYFGSAPIREGEVMISKERVFKTYNFESPDLIPVDFCADVPVYETIIEKTGVKDQFALMEYFHIDFRWARVKWIGLELVDSEGHPTDYFGIRREGEAFGYAGTHPLSHVRTKRDVDAYPWPKAEYWDYDVFVEECERFEETQCMEELGDGFSTQRVILWEWTDFS